MKKQKRKIQMRDKEISEIIGEILLNQPRKKWCDLLLPYIKTVEKYGLEFVYEDSDVYLPDMNHFSEFYKGKFNIGDYVTHDIYGGYYRITSLEALDIRAQKIWSKTKMSPIQLTEFIWEHGDRYLYFGIDEKGQYSGSEIYMYGIHAGKDILFGECKERHLTLVPKNKIPQETKDKVNKFVYQFNYLPEILKQLKETE